MPISNLTSVTEVVSPLRSFALTNLTGDSFGLLLDWKFVAIALDKHRHISNPLLSSQLTVLRLEYVCNVPPTLFSICINLTSITFQNVELQLSSPYTQEEETGILSRPRILELKLLHFSRENLLNRLFPPGAPSLVDLRGLRTFTIFLSPPVQIEDLVAVRELMEISKDCLLHFSWYHWQNISPGVSVFLILFLVYLLTDMQEHLWAPTTPSAIDLSLFPVLRVLEVVLMVDLWQESYLTVYFLLSTLSTSPITRDKLKITIYIEVDGREDFTDGEETEDDDASEEPEDDTSYIARIRLDYSGLRWRKLVNAILRTSRSKLGSSEINPIARHILFDFSYPRLESDFSQKQKETYRFDWEKSISALVKKEFYKLVRGGDIFKFEYVSHENEN